MYRNKIICLCIWGLGVCLALFSNILAEDDMKPTIVTAELGAPRIDMTSKGDVWEATWADDGELYTVSDDTMGFNNQPGRNLQYHILRGAAAANLVGETVNRMDEYGPQTFAGPDKCMWKANGNICVDGVLYVFVSRHVLASDGQRQGAINSSLIKSLDKGRSWQRSAEENYRNPMFPGRRFGSPFFIQYGQDGRATVHNADKYLYALANDGFWDNGDDMILARVARARIGRLDAADWEFHTGGDGMPDANWSRKIQNAQPLLNKPGKCSMTGAQYIAPLKRYLMIQWHYVAGAGHGHSDDTIWEFYESPRPWGPYRQFATQRFKPEGYYNPCIVSKFISQDGRHLTIFTNGDFATWDAAGQRCLYRLTVIPCTLRTETQ